MDGRAVGGWPAEGSHGSKSATLPPEFLMRAMSFVLISVACIAVAGAAGCRQPDHIVIEPHDPVLKTANDSVLLIGKVMTGDFHHVKERVRWSSKDESIVRVDEVGVVTPVGAGRAVVVATWGSLSAEAIVEADLVEALKTEAEEVVLSYEAGDPVKPAVVAYGYGGRVLKDRAPFYKPADSRVCRVDSKGQFWPVERGETVVTASLEKSSVSIRCKVE